MEGKETQKVFQFEVRISDCSTNLDDSSPQKPSRISELISNPWNFTSPTSPKSELFNYPETSPMYNQLNESLQELYNSLDLYMDQNTSKEPERIVQVQNTITSSLLLRRKNKIQI